MAIIGVDSVPHQPALLLTPGPSIELGTDVDPIKYFNFFFDTYIADHIVQETNRYADQWIKTQTQYL